MKQRKVVIERDQESKLRKTEIERYDQRLFYYSNIDERERQGEGKKQRKTVIEIDQESITKKKEIKRQKQRKRENDGAEKKEYIWRQKQWGKRG